MFKNLTIVNWPIRLFARITLKYGIAAVALLLISILSTKGAAPVEAQTTPVTFNQEAHIQSKQLDDRAVILQKYLADRNSPLQDNAQDFIDAADQNHVDWKLLPAISGVESTYGVNKPAGSYNGWGWGGSNLVYFTSWTDAIYTIDQALDQKYHVGTVADPYVINRTYAASTTWGARVSSNMNDIDQYVKSYEAEKPVDLTQDIHLAGLLNKKASTCYNLECVTNDSGSTSGQINLLSDSAI